MAVARTLVALVAALLLPGCTTSDGEPESAPPPSTGEPGASQPPAAGTTTPGQPEPSQGPAQAVPPGPAAPVPKSWAVAEDGLLGGPTVFAPVVGAAWVWTVSGSDRWFRQDVPGTVTGADLTMTWEAAQPSSEELALFFTPIEETENGETFTGPTISVTGTSPLRLAADGLDWSYGMYTVAVWYPNIELSAYPLPQEFHIEGTILHVA